MKKPRQIFATASDTQEAQELILKMNADGYLFTSVDYLDRFGRETIISFVFTLAPRIKTKGAQWYESTFVESTQQIIDERASAGYTVSFMRTHFIADIKLVSLFFTKDECCFSTMPQA